VSRTADEPRTGKKRVRRSPLVLGILALLAGGAFWWPQEKAAPPGEGVLVLYGNVEIRQVDLAFGVDGPLAHVLVDEGDRVEAGQTLAVLDQAAFNYADANAAAMLRSADARLAELIAGSRRLEIQQARAAVASAEASLENASQNLKRAEELSRRDISSKQTLDSTRMLKRTTEAQLRQAESDLGLRLEGTREEQITQQRAELEARRANLATQRYRLERSTLRAPNAGIVLTRIREPGSVVTANTPVLTVSLIDPVWVRTYVDEPHLGRAAPGTRVEVTTDSMPGKTYVGRIGFVSPTAEFTPKSIETPELRTALVYRVRIIVENPDSALRQGMPATLRIAPAEPAS
jgi:HlyD family secretion protein